MTTKATYDKAATIINKVLKQYDDEAFTPRVSVLDTANHGYGFGKYSLVVNDTAYDLIQLKGMAQDIFYADETIVIGDNDYYLEPINSTCFGLALY